ncbi:MAG TPA: response regulator [Thermoanaerobaculia bacterium]|nr:response regulator [Thermoanaerobaculia bacterium]
MNKRLLILENEETVLFALQRYFSRVGFIVDCASELEEAEALATHTPYDLAILDLALTTSDGTEGLEFLRYLRAVRSRARVIMLTAYATAAVQREAHRRGVDAFLCKPRPLAEIARVAESLIGGFA